MLFFDKRVLNFLVIIFLSLVTSLLTYFITGISAGLTDVAVIIVVRLACSYFILNDYSMSWSKASNKTNLIKTFVNTAAFCIYIPILAWNVSFRYLLSEYITYTMVINFSIYLYNFLNNRSAVVKEHTVIIYGAGKAGVKLLEEFRRSAYQIRYFVDDDTSLQKRAIDGIRIISDEKLMKIIKRGKKYDVLIIAMPSVENDRIVHIYDRYNDYFDKVYILPALNEILQGRAYSQQIKNVTLEDLLARTPKDLDKETISNFLVHKVALITGAGGSIGSEICRQCIRYGVNKLILVENCEFNLYKITEELSSDRIVPILADVTDFNKINGIFAEYKPDIVIHAAAYKHVPLCELNSAAAINNNIFGTKNVVDACVAQNIKKMILISTDKAVRPTNVMGATKRVCELYAQNMSSDATEITSVRFGNVLGSSGSVIPKFKSQIERGGPVTVTHPEVTRYFMLIPEACELVLQAGSIGRGKEIFILNMGQPFKIVDLAKKMIRLSGAKNIDISFTGLRPGEKLYEELLVNETDVKTNYESITIAKQTNYDINALLSYFDRLKTEEDKISVLKQILPEEFKMVGVPVEQ